MKIKKIIFILFLTLSFIFTSLHFQQKKAEAVVPALVWVGVNVAVSLVVGAILYFTEDDGTETLQQIESVNTTTGEITLGSGTGTTGWWDCGQEMKVWTTTNRNPNITFYPVQEWMLPFFPDRGGFASMNGSMNQSVANSVAGGVFMIYYLDCFKVHWAQINDGPDDYLERLNFTEPFSNEIVTGGMGNHFQGDLKIDNQGNFLDIPLDMFEFQEDIPTVESCFDGIQNQDETGIDCGGVCELNFGLACFVPPVPSCNDGIMNQDETGIDYGGVCGTGTPVSQPPANFTDTNQDGIDDISGLDDTGSIPVGTVSVSVGTADSTTYDASLPGNVSDVGETDWSGLITGYLSSNPLVLLATGSQINVTGATCSLPLTLFGKSMSIDFCSLDWMVDLFGSFVLGLMAIRAVFIAMGV